MSENIGGTTIKANYHCARLKGFLDPVVDDNIVDEDEELDNGDSECAGEQEAANGKGMGDSVHHEVNITTRSKDVRMKNSKVTVQSSVK